MWCEKSFAWSVFRGKCAESFLSGRWLYFFVPKSRLNSVYRKPLARVGIYLLLTTHLARNSVFLYACTRNMRDWEKLLTSTLTRKCTLAFGSDSRPPRVRQALAFRLINFGRRIASMEIGSCNSSSTWNSFHSGPNKYEKVISSSDRKRG